MKNIEYEYKIIISHDKFKLLKKYLKNEFKFSEYTQKNTYFDDKFNTLKQNNSALRIREKNNILEWTFKKKVSDLKKLELKQITKTLDFTSINHNIKNQLDLIKLDYDSLSKLCFIKTTRIDFKFYNSTLSLDYSKFNNKFKDYELELEVGNKDDIIWFEKLLKHFDIKLILAPSKIQRAMENI